MTVRLSAEELRQLRAASVETGERPSALLRRGGVQLAREFAEQEVK